MTEKTVLVRIEGKVQGVWFRAWTEKTAAGHGLSGWVRNRPDGSVQALFSGPAAAVDRMLEDCRDGPRLAQVRDLQTEAADPPAESGFRVLEDG
jgi:acylphosphatase